MILELDTHIRKIVCTLEERLWTPTTQNLWRQSALAVFCRFIEHNQHPHLAAHVVHSVLDEISRALTDQTIRRGQPHPYDFCVESTQVNGHSLHLLLIPQYTIQYCAHEVERLRNVGAKSPTAQSTCNPICK